MKKIFITSLVFGLISLSPIFTNGIITSSYSVLASGVGDGGDGDGGDGEGESTAGDAAAAADGESTAGEAAAADASDSAAATGSVCVSVTGFGEEAYVMTQEQADALQAAYPTVTLTISPVLPPVVNINFQ